MKKFIILVFIFAMMLTLVACNKEDEPPKDNGSSTPTDQEEDVNETEDPLEWGVMDQFSADNENLIESYYINFPHYTGVSEGHSMIAEQLDGTVALISGQNIDSPEISSTAELFPAYFDQLQNSLESYYGLRSSNYELSLTNTDSTTIGEYDMYIFTGTIAFDYDLQGEILHREYQFISYATTLKSNRAYAYWVVYDETEDQSKGELIKEHALNMAKTFREEPNW